MGVLCLVLVLLCITKCSLSFCNYLDKEESAGCLTLIVFLMSCDSQCSVGLPQGVVGWSAYFLIILAFFFTILVNVVFEPVCTLNVLNSCKDSCIKFVHVIRKLKRLKIKTLVLKKFY